MSRSSKKSNNLFFFITLFLVFTGVIVICFSSIFFEKGGNLSDITSNSPHKFRVVIDAGHGGRDEGSKYNKLVEKNITLAIAERIKSLSAQYGVDVVMTRSSDAFINPAKRIAIADRQNADAYVSIHVNELRGYEYVSGMQIYVSNHNPQFDKSCVLGSAVAKSLSTDFKVFNKLQDRSKNIYVLSENTLPSILVECGFITNLSDEKMLTDTATETLIAKQILQGVAMFKDNKVKELYAVQLPRSLQPAVNKNITAAYRPLTQKKPVKKANRLT